ncbi:helix-turn-helix domain-containing protein [Roseateles amylovorans]
MISEFKKSAIWAVTEGHHPGNSEMTSTPASPPNLLRVTDATAVGPAIRARRREQSLRIDDAASLSGVSVDLLSRLENGKGAVRLDKLLAVLDSLGLALMLGPKDHPGMQAASRPAVARPQKS